MATMYGVDRLREQIGELVERHEVKRSLAEFAKYRDDPVRFIREELRGEPWSRQIEIAEAVLDNRLVVVRAGNGLGKDWLAARLALWWTYCRGGLAIVTGPTERQVKEIVMGEVRRAFASAHTLPGGSVVDRLREEGWTVDGYNGGSSPKRDPENRFTNRRAESFWTLRKMFEEDAIDVPEDEDLWEALTSIKWFTNSAGKIQIEPKEETRETLGRSPDDADALAMCVSDDMPPQPQFYAGISYSEQWDGVQRVLSPGSYRSN